MLDSLNSPGEDTRLLALASLSPRVSEPRINEAFTDLVLHDPSYSVRAQAVWELRVVHNPDTLAVLNAALADPHPQVKETAIVSLAPLADFEIMQNMQPLLDDSSVNVRQQAISSIASQLYRFPQALDWLTPGLTSSDTYIRSTTISALGGQLRDFPQLTDSFLTIAADPQEVFGLRQSAMLSLSQVEGPRVDDFFINSFNNPDWRIRYSSVLGLSGNAGPQDIDFLNQAVSDSHWQVRAASIYALGQAGDAQAIDVISAGLDDPNWQVRQTAATSLANFDSQDTFDLLVPMLGDYNRQVRLSAFDSLQFGLGENEEVVDVFKDTLLGHNDPFLRQQAAFALSSLDSPDVLPDLTVALDDSHPRVRMAAALALVPRADLTSARPFEVLLNVPGIEAQALAIRAASSRLVEFPQMADLITPGLESNNLYIRSVTIDSLSPYLEDLPQLQEPFLDIAQNPHQPIEFRQNALFSLSFTGNPQAHSFIFDELTSPDWRMRQAAALSFSNIPDFEPIPELTSLTQDPYWQVRAAVAETLSGFGDSSVNDSLITLLEDDSFYVRRIAIESLGTRVSEEPELVEPLARFAREEPNYLVRMIASLYLPSVEAAELSSVDQDLSSVLESVKAIVIVPPTDDFDPSTSRGNSEIWSEHLGIRRTAELRGVEVFEHYWSGNMFDGEFFDPYHEDFKNAQIDLDSTVFKALEVAGEDGIVWILGYERGGIEIVQQRFSSPDLSPEVKKALQEKRIQFLPVKPDPRVSYGRLNYTNEELKKGFIELADLIQHFSATEDSCSIDITSSINYPQTSDMSLADTYLIRKFLSVYIRPQSEKYQSNQIYAGYNLFEMSTSPPGLINSTYMWYNNIIQSGYTGFNPDYMSYAPSGSVYFGPDVTGGVPYTGGYYNTTPGDSYLPGAASGAYTGYNDTGYYDFTQSGYSGGYHHVTPGTDYTPPIGNDYSTP
ncbi:MAG: hypothetical protein GF375_04870 [Candidatus Omnitrophica bacterium]|nr:hypothetical protein [Candidatus Omnitrophota bacterium]